jgi:hypothetical protein
MEACCGARHMGRVVSQQGHEIRLMSPEYVRPYVISQKNADRDVRVAGARLGSQQNMRALELARRMLAGVRERREFAALSLAEFDPVAYIHLCLLAVRGTNERLNRMSGVWRPQKVSRPSRAGILCIKPRLDLTDGASLSNRVLVPPVALKLQDKLSRSACPGARNFHDFPPLPR